MGSETNTELAVYFNNIPESMFTCFRCFIGSLSSEMHAYQCISCILLIQIQ